MGSGDALRAGHPFVVAHRGASAERPEHTLAAYGLALQQGADGVECDVRLSRDGHLVCVHDRRIDRTSTGTGLVSEMTLAQLRAFDYGAWHGSWRSDGSHGETGLLTPDGDAAALADAVASLLDDPDRRRTMGRAAADYVARTHGLPAAARRLDTILRSLA